MALWKTMCTFRHYRVYRVKHVFVYVRDRLPTQPVLKPLASFKTGRPTYRQAGPIDHPAIPPGTLSCF